MSAPHYYTLVTDAGHTRLTEALATAKPVVLSHFAFGDGNGAAYDPTPDQTALRREVWRTEINSIRTDPKNPAWLTVEAVIPARVGGWTVREAGVFDADGTMIAIAKYPESFKPQLDDGVGKDLCCRMILQHGNVSAVTLKIDPSVVLATRDHVSAEVAAAIASHAGPG
ncbi:phage tail protein, partial [Haematospirillum jordaniae]